ALRGPVVALLHAREPVGGDADDEVVALLHGAGEEALVALVEEVEHADSEPDADHDASSPAVRLTGSIAQSQVGLGVRQSMPYFATRWSLGGYGAQKRRPMKSIGARVRVSYA